MIVEWLTLYAKHCYILEAYKHEQARFLPSEIWASTGDNGTLCKMLLKLLIYIHLNGFWIELQTIIYIYSQLMIIVSKNEIITH